MFEDRLQAGEELAKALVKYKNEDPLILALPRGGVPLGHVVAAALDAPLDIVVVRKIGAPGQHELAIGAIVDGETPEVVLNEEIVEAASIPEDYIEKEKEALLEEIARRNELYRKGRERESVSGRTVIVVDDGIATGATVRASLRAIRRGDPKKLVLAVPVAPQDTVAALKSEVDELICLETPDPFYAISLFYGSFPQVDDEEVIQLLAENYRVRHAEGAG